MSPGKGGGFFVGFTFGALAGGVLAYIIMQEEARDVLLGKAREAGNFAADAGGDLRGRVGEVAASIQNNAADLYARGKNVVETARTTINAAIDEGQTTAEQVRGDLSRKSQMQSQTQTPDS